MNTAGAMVLVAAAAVAGGGMAVKRLTPSQKTVKIVEAARARLKPLFRDVGIAYPPSRVVLVGLKAERRLQVHAAGPSRAFGLGETGRAPLRFVAQYPVVAASGGPGPKLREGDQQVPEGVYRVVHVNPESSYHVSLGLDYPNAADRSRAAADKRTKLGGEIYIHGGAESIGCLAMGDTAAEDLFTLVRDTGRGNIKVILAPANLRDRPETATAITGTGTDTTTGTAVSAVMVAATIRAAVTGRPAPPPWTVDLYHDIRAELAAMPEVPGPGRRVVAYPDARRAFGTVTASTSSSLPSITIDLRPKRDTASTTETTSTAKP